MSPKHRVAALAASLAVAALGLTGCAGGTRWSDLDREPSADDAIPGSVTWVDGADESSVRFVGEYEGTRLWLLRTERGICLVQYPESKEWASGCTEPAGEFATSGPGGSFRVYPDDGIPPDDAVQISENVYATS
ncbi:hypothetical protein LQ938_02695 [Microbacterium sp. cx-55]|uniref:hypothetical protein n=1 Tax=Microbacterium sp. cx-55 TaxID=2875948 RepID=UPI001CBBA681|nr:hypothetical protein [Microbacterium sp. cx-55]MBZ4487717.1 hypothetical protein [Microbacterium sp. cx-55]UGB35727.1 hypothetical protein LQ938_02695 [Microbacterium sp. cx-55]